MWCYNDTHSTKRKNKLDKVTKKIFKVAFIAKIITFNDVLKSLLIEEKVLGFFCHYVFNVFTKMCKKVVSGISFLFCN